MDLFQFVNSRDIRAHLRSINYRFTTMEAAWLVWQNRYTPLAQKHEAWEYIIETMPDQEIRERRNTTPRPSLHGFMRELMAFEDARVDLLKRPEPGVVYYYAFLCPCDSDWIIDNDDLSSGFDLCMEQAAAQLTRLSNSLLFSLKDCRVRISKIWIDSAKRTVTAEFDGEGTLLSIVSHGDCSDYENELICCGFEGMWFAFPTPFQRGDVVCRRGCEDEKDLWTGPFVIEQVLPEGKVLKRLEKNGDYTDMTAYGYFLNSETGEIYHECMHDYMSLEYYRGEFTGARRVLKALGNFLKDEIDVELYSQAYRTILEEEHLRKITPQDGWFTREGLALAGLQPNNTETR